MMEELEEFSSLVAALYDAAMGNSPFWPLGQEIAARFGTESCAMWVQGGFNGPVDMLALTDNYVSGLASYSAYYHKIDVWALRAQSQPQGVMLCSDTIISDDEFRRTEFYQDHCRPQGVFYALGGVISLGQPNAARGFVSVHRAEKDGPFTASTERQGAILLPHVKRAMQLRERLSQLDMQQRSLTEATDALGVGVIVTNRDARIIYANPVAEILLRRQNGLEVQNERVKIAQPFRDDELRRIIRDAAGASVGRALNAGGLVRIPRVGRRPIGLSVYPFTVSAKTAGNTIPAALIFVVDPDASRPPRREALAQMYGLTAAEARLFEALLTGERLQEYADRCSLSVQTVKTQLAHVFHKTDCSRQTDLMRLALSNPLLRASCPKS